MHCRLGKGWLLRHNSVLSALADCIRSAGYTVYNQSQSVGDSSSRPLTDDPSQHRPDLDVMGAAFLHASCYVEFSVTSPFQVDVISRSSQSPLYAARQRESHKLGKYAAKALADRRELRVAVMESTGAFGPALQDLLQLLSDVGSHSADFLATSSQRAWSSNNFKRYWMQRIALAFWRGHTIMVAETRQQRLARLRSARESSRVFFSLPPSYSSFTSLST